MKKTFLFLCIIFCIIAQSKAQFGSEFISGIHLNYIGGGRALDVNGERVNLGYTLKVSLSPGYFVTNNLALGSFVGYEFMKNNEARQYTIDVRPYIRYYTPGGNVRFFMHLDSGYGWGESKLKEGNDGRHKLWISTLKPGIFMRINDNVATEVTVSSLEYKRVNIEDKVTRDKMTTEKWKFRALDVSFAVSLIYEF